MYNGVYTNYKSTFVNGQLYRSSPFLKNSARPVAQNNFHSKFEDAFKNSIAKIKNYDFSLNEDSFAKNLNALPTARTMYNNDLNRALLYTGRALLNAGSYSSIGNFLNLVI